MAVRRLGGRRVPEPPPDSRADRVVIKDLGRAFAVFVLLHDAARRRLALGVQERVVQVHVVVHAPAEVLVEGRGAVEHLVHIADAVDRPTTNVLVEDRGAGEHPFHIRDAVNRPTTDVLVEGRGAEEHPVHGLDAGGFPCADVLVEGRGAEEHAAQRRDARGVPRADVLVKGRRGRVVSVIAIPS